MSYDISTEPRECKRMLMEKIVTLLMNIVNKNCISYEKNYLPEPCTPFDNIFPLSVDSFILLTDITQDDRIEENVLVYSLMLLDRFSKSSIAFYPFTKKNILLLLVCSIMITQKFLYDICFKNQFFSNVLNISLYELNKAENLFLDNIDFQVLLNDEKLNLYKSLLRKVQT